MAGLTVGIGGCNTSDNVEADPQHEAQVASEHDILRGEWEMVRYTIPKVFRTSAFYPGIMFLDRGKYAYECPVTGRKEGSYWIDPTTEPKRIDTTVSTGGESYTRKGIYRLQGDELTIIMTLPGCDRPTSFETSNDDALVGVYERRAAIKGVGSL